MERKKKPLLIGCAIFIVLIFTSAICMFGFSQISRLLFRERATNLSVLVEKITQNLDSKMESTWKQAEFCAKCLDDADVSSTNALLKKVSELQHWLGGGMNSVLIFDSDGMCFAADGLSFHWPDSSVLTHNGRTTYFGVKEQTWKNVDQIFFIAKFSKEIVVDGKHYTHVAVAQDMSELDDYFKISSFSERGMTFVIRKNGTQVYRPENAGSIGRVYNLLSFLKRLEYFHRTSVETLLEDIENNKSGVVSVKYDDETYFVVYHKMQEQDWYALFFAPESVVGVNSVRFMGDIILYISGVAVLILILLVTIIVTSTKEISKKQEMANASLQKAIEAEHNASLAKTRFLSSMSHDIRTPMNAIIGMTTIAQKHLDDREHIESCLEKISLSGNHLLALINDILDISKIESGKMTLTPIVFSLADAAKNLVNIVRPQIKAKDLHFDIRIHKIKHEYLYADELRLNQIFINLLSNAVKYTPEGGRIMLDMEELPVEGNDKAVKLVYTVQDNGIGMSPEFQKTMYNIFARADGDRVGKIQGAGLGLSITKQMVELMDGTIECDSAEGVGTKFTVTITLQIAEKTLEEFSLPQISVLVVDDDEAFLESSEDTLKSMGMIVETVDNGEDAIKKIAERHEKNQDYTLVIVDWKMPKMNGLETTKGIRAKVGEGLPIILVSSYDWTEIEDEAKGAGANGFIGKPFFRSTVYYELGKYLEIDGVARNEEEDTADDLKGLNVLVAEDIEVNWEVISEILDMYDIKTEHAENGKVCVEKLLASPKGYYDLILMDVKMPEMDGREATRAIRRCGEANYEDIPIIAMTADAFAEDITASIEAGMDGHVSKPVDMDQLFQEIRRVLRIKKSSRYIPTEINLDI